MWTEERRKQWPKTNSLNKYGDAAKQLWADIKIRSEGLHIGSTEWKVALLTKHLIYLKTLQSYWLFSEPYSASKEMFYAMPLQNFHYAKREREMEH